MKWLIFLIPVMAFSQYTFPLKMSANNRYFVDQNNKPFFFAGDAPWDLPAGEPIDSMMIYMKNADSLGFTFFEVRAITKTFTRNAPNNSANDAPFTGAIFQSSLGTNYWNLFTAMLDSAKARNMVVWVFPDYLGYGGVGSTEGFYDETASATAAQMKTYGAALGHILKTHNNVVLGFGGDTNPSSLQAKIDSLSRGIMDSINLPRVLRNEPETWGHTYFPTDTLLNTWDGFYTKSFTPSLYTWAASAYNRTPSVPCIKQEDIYENESATTLQVREETYWSVLGGGTQGYIVGNCPLWNFAQWSGGLCSGWTGGWVSHLQDPGRKSHQYFNTIIKARNWYTLVPDTANAVADSGYSSGTTYCTTAFASDSSCIVSYLPTQHNIRVKLAYIKGDSVAAKWVNASTGVETDLGKKAKVTTTFAAPTNADYVLVLDSFTNSQSSTFVQRILSR